MHDTAFLTGSNFISTYASSDCKIIVEIGALNVNGTLRECCPKSCRYLGLDVEYGDGVDIKIDTTKPLPLRNGFSDLTISTSQMEHDPRFWMTFLELCRITKPSGLIYLSAPSNGAYHRYPVDVWRFYPDAGHALVSWAKENGFDVTLVESFVVPRRSDAWSDFVAVFFVGPGQPAGPTKFIADYVEGYNVWKLGHDTIQNERVWTEDQELITSRSAERDQLRAELRNLHNELAELKAENERLVTEVSVTKTLIDTVRASGELVAEASRKPADGVEPLASSDSR